MTRPVPCPMRSRRGADAVPDLRADVSQDDMELVMTNILPTYTPGPWVASYADALVDADCQPSINAGGTSLAMVRRKRGIALPEAIANACLIAAAPELVAALRNINATFEAYGKQRLPEYVRKEFAPIRALLAKIDGEQP